MTTHAKFLLALIITALTLSIGVGSASALRSISVVGETTVAGSGRVTFTSSEGGTRIECNVTITRTISRTIPKIAGILLGKIIRIDTGFPEAGCRASLGTLQGIDILGIEREERGRLFFTSITGTLPSMTGKNELIKGLLIGFRTRIVIIGTITCLYGENGAGAEVRMRFDAERRITEAQIGTNTAIILERQPGSCPREGRLTGTLRETRGPRFILI